MLGVPPPERAVRHWHVAPWVDVCAYAFSWLPFAIAVAFLGNDRQHDYLWGYLIVLAVTDVHRHYGFPYVYMDRQVFGRHPLRFVLFPAAMFALFVLSPYLSRGTPLTPFGVAATAATGVVLVQLLRRDRPNLRTPAHELVFAALPAAGLAFALAGTFGAAGAVWIALVAFSAGLDLFAYRAHRKLRVGLYPAAAIATGLVPLLLAPGETIDVRHLINFAAIFAGAWNIWHVYMQKYGIFRMYAAKSGARENTVPGWVDRLLVFAWLPFYLFYLGATYRTEIDRLFSRGRDSLGPLLDVFGELAPIMMWPTGALIVVSLGLWLRYEHRATGLRNPARLTMMVGTTLLASTFLLLDPLKAYLAYAFSHGIEYMVFVWAYQRRRYHEPLAHRPFIARFLRWPIVTYVLSALLLGAAFTYLKYYGRWLFPEARMPRIDGITTYEWVGYWTVYQSMVHFYFDGFLWKMRLPSVRATVGA